MFKWNSKSGGSDKKQRDPGTGFDPYSMDDPSGCGAIEELEDLIEPDPAEEDKELHAAQESFRAIESVLQEMESPEQKQEASFTMPLRDAFMLVPDAYRSRAEMDPGEAREISIFVDDLYEQLARGKLAIPLAKFVLDMPPDLVLSEAHQDDHTMISPPLHAVIAAIDPDALAERTASVPVDMGCADQLPDPFGKAEVSQELETETPPPGETPEPEIPEPEAPAEDPPQMPTVSEDIEDNVEEEPEALVSEPEPEAVAETPVMPADTPEPPEPAQEDEMPEQFGGLNINTAVADQLLTLPGSTPGVVREIIRYRDANGPFHNIFELRKVPLVGRITFRKMTGMPYSQGRNHRIRKLMKLLGLSIHNVHHLPTLVRKLAELPEFAGCIVSDVDGLLLAEQGAADCAEAFSAIIPRMYQQMQDVTTEVWPDQVDLLSVCIGDRMFSVVKRGNIYLGAFLSRRKMTKSQLRFVEKVAEELAWLLSHRAYAGPSATWRTEQGRSNW